MNEQEGKREGTFRIYLSEVRVFIVVLKHHDQGQFWLERKGLFHLNTSISYSIIKNLDGREHKGMLTDLFLMAFSACFLTEQDHQPRGGIAYSELGPPTSIKKVHHRLSHRPIWWGHFLS